MTHFVPRTCTEIGEDGSPIEAERASDRSTDWPRVWSGNDSPAESGYPSRSLEYYRETDAYVLLGAPGAGKTVAFSQEAECGRDHYVTARDFITFDDRSEWHDATLFIDGLDEMRAGAADGRTPLDGIRAKLDRIGRPRFRLSCREADWFGANDRENLKSVSRGGEVEVLRLDPLSDDGVRELLGRQSGIKDADQFIASARERGIDGLLANPQSLLMLAQAVSDGSWPETRMQTFELACRRLVREHNTEHQSAHRSQELCESELLHTAGRLCAVQLLTGRAGYILLGDGNGSEYLGLQQISGGNQATLRHVLGTRLFVSPGENHVAPTHRQIAEFLAGRHLAWLIGNGLPVGRVLALMTGEDGGIVSEMRGLSAWTAAHCEAGRREIIDRDPLGTILYGDVRGFSHDEKRQVLNCLDREARRNPWFAITLRLDSQLGSLATPDMKDVFGTLLIDPARNDARQWIVFVLMQSLAHGQKIPEIDDLLIEVARDEQWRPEVKLGALEALIRHRESGADTGKLKTLLTDVYSGSVPDPDGDLSGSLLSALYPESLSVPEVLQYLRPHRSSSYAGMYLRFWAKHLPEKSTDAQLIELLDAAVEQFTEPISVPGEYWEQISPGRLVLRLLARFLDIAREDVSPRRLLHWLRVASQDESWDSSDDAMLIQSWLTSHPEAQREIIAASAEHCADSSDFSSCMYDYMPCIEHLIRNDTPSMDFQYCCLEQAASASHRSAAEYFVRRVADFVHKGRHGEGSSHQGLSREIVVEHLAGRADLLDTFTESLDARAAIDTKFQERRAKHRERLAIRESTEQKSNHYRVKPHQTALEENRGSPELLHHLAGYYFQCMETGVPEERLLGVFGRDEDLIEAILEGFRGSVNRSDVPGAAEIIRLRKKNCTHYLALPFLAGLEELLRVAPMEVVFPDEERIRQAFAFHYTGDDSFRPSWYDEVLKSHTELAAETLVRSIRAAMPVVAEPSLFGVFRLRECRKLARFASLPLLEAFPVRCSVYKLRALGYLAGNALLYCNTEHLLRVVDKKLACRGMHVGQRVCWLATGLLASTNPDSADSYRETLKEYVDGRERRVKYLAGFLNTIEYDSDSPSTITESLDASSLRVLIRLLGVYYGPNSYNSSDIGFIVRRFISRLESISSVKAAEALDALVDDEALRAWHPYLVDAGYGQKIVRREAEFRHADADQVVMTLDNRRPANVADLAALTFDFLAGISRNIRDGSTSDWRQYWNWDQKSHRRCLEPMHEDHCRDRLLSDLQGRIGRLGIDAVPEGRYSDEKRSDIRVSCGGFNVPLEIKKSDHRKLWSAIRSQLIAKYTRDPNAGGHGIYVVFWFGKDYCQPPESGSRPGGAAELEKRLRDTLSREEARMIRVCVIDVTESRA